MSNNVALEQRLLRVERWNRFLAAALVLLITAILTFGSGLSATDAEQKSISASAFQLIDSNGKVVAALKVGVQGPGLFILDPQGRNRIALTHEPAQSGLFILDEAGDSRIGIVQFAHRGGDVALHGPETRGAAVLYYKNDGSLSFYDTDGKVIDRYPRK